MNFSDPNFLDLNLQYPHHQTPAASSEDKSGRGKINIEKINNIASRQVTFTKRRKGLFKKAKELAILCDVEVGAVVFSSTNKVYEFASNSSMETLVEKYNKAQEENQLLNPSSEAKLWKLEAESLRLQLEDLRKYHKRLRGEDLSELDIDHIEKLESQLETSKEALRTRKEEAYRDKMEEHRKQEFLIRQENMELRTNLNAMQQEITELRDKIHRAMEEPEASGNSIVSTNMSRRYTSVTLQLSPPEDQDNRSI